MIHTHFQTQGVYPESSHLDDVSEMRCRSLSSFDFASSQHPAHNTTPLSYDVKETRNVLLR